MDVEAILGQIRERVISGEDARASTRQAAPNGSAAHASVNEPLTRAAAQLVVTGRAWDRLPPVYTNRRGALARLELWIKKTCKPLTRWFTWEQVNFNRAVNDALVDVIEVLRVEAHELALLRAQLTNEMHRELVTLRSEIEASERARSALEARLSALEPRLHETNAALARLSEMLASLADEARGGHAQLANKLNELAADLHAEQLALKSAQDQALDHRLADLAAELREDQRVCFRQLSLEASESAVLEDRGRREVLTRLEKLEGKTN
jgi:uncharacterized coiled-coil protein SlyX